MMQRSVELTVLSGALLLGSKPTGLEVRHQGMGDKVEIAPEDLSVQLQVVKSGYPESTYSDLCHLRVDGKEKQGGA